MSMPEQPVKDGYIFDGWFLGTTEFTGTEPVYENLTLVAKWIKINETFNYDEMEFVSLGSIGGANASLFGCGVIRDEQAIHFRFESTEKLIGTDAIGLFVSVGDISGTSRSATTFLFQAFVSGDIYVYNYPNNSKKLLVSGSDRLVNGIMSCRLISSDRSVIYITVPYSFFNGVIDGLTFNRRDVIGLSMTADNTKNNTWDVWTSESFKGVDGKKVVDRENVKDYLRISSKNMLFDYENNSVDTIIKGSLGVSGVTVSAGTHSVVSNDNGEWEIKLLRGEVSEVKVTISKAGYETSEKSISLEDRVLTYCDQTTLTMQCGNIVGKVSDYVSGEAISNALILCNEKQYYTDENGKFTLTDVPLARSLQISVSASNYETAELTYLDSEIVSEDFEISASLISYGTEFVVYGNIVNSYEPIEGVAISANGYQAQTDGNGKYELTITYGDYELEINSDGYISDTVKISRQQLLSGENFSLDLGEVELVREYSKWCQEGGTNVAPVWDVWATRTSKELRFLLTTESELNSSVTNGVGLFLQLGERNSSTRTEKTICIPMYATGTAVYSNYPNNSKKTISLSGIEVAVTTENGKTIINGVVPYSTLFSYESVTAKSDIGVSLTIDCGSSWEIWESDIFLGKSGTAEVNRSNPWDFLVWDKNNTLSDYDVTEEDFNARVVSVTGDMTRVFFENMAEFSVDANTTIVTLKDQTAIFTDRPKYLFDEQVAKAILGKKFTYSSIANGPSITVTKAGYMLLVVPGGSSYNSLNSAILGDGWQVILSKFNKTATISDQFTYYVKWCEEGEEYSYGKWNFFVTT